jgi:hypothetical protein
MCPLPRIILRYRSMKTNEEEESRGKRASIEYLARARSVHGTLFPSHLEESKEPISHLLGLLLLFHGTSNGQSVGTPGSCSTDESTGLASLTSSPWRKSAYQQSRNAGENQQPSPNRFGGCNLLSAQGSNRAQSLKFSCWTVAGIIHPSGTNSVLRIKSFCAIPVPFRQAPVRCLPSD